MAKQALRRGMTAKIVRLFIGDSTSATGAGLTGLTAASAGLVAYYAREGDAVATAIALAAGTVGTWSSGGFVAVDGTNLPGVYELGLPNAVLAAGNSVLVMLRGAANMVPCVAEYELDAFDPQDAVALGLGRLDASVSSRATPAQILVTPANPLLTNASGQVQQDMSQVVPAAPTQGTVGDALLAAEAQGVGKWTLVGTTLTLYRHDGSTVVRTFTLDSATAPMSRS